MANNRIQHHFYINNCLGSFYRGTLNYFSKEFIKFNYKVIGTYDKAVEFFNKKTETHGIKIPPSITLDPSGEFEPEERGGKFLWQYPNLAPAMGAAQFEPIYQDNQMIVTPVFTRFKGTIEIMMWLESIYEYLDLRTLIYIWSGGLNRILRPIPYKSYIILPDEILNYTYSNNVTEQAYQIDWRSTDAVLTLVRNIAQEKVVYPITMNPTYKITGVSDGSEKYGGDKLAEYRLNLSVEYEIELPTYIHIQSDWKIEHMNMNFELGTVYSQYGTSEPSVSLEELNKKYSTEEPFSDIADMEDYRIENSALDGIENRILAEGDNLVFNPSKSSIINWNPIISGRLVMINSPADWLGIEKGDIIYSPEFTEDDLPYMRIAKGFLSPEASKSQKFVSNKVGLLKTTYVGGLDSTQVINIQNVDGGLITLDPHTEKIYEGVLPVEKLSVGDPRFGDNALSGLYKSHEDQVKDTIKVGSGSDLGSKSGVYSDAIMLKFGVDSTATHVESFDLYQTDKAIYSFQSEDVGKDNVSINSPFPLDDKDKLVLLSYAGKMEYGRDYTFDVENNLIISALQPKLDEVIEFYYYVIK